nr:ribonuclease H-like domain-containing protein [Tanacetum cinerariifolium]
MKKKVEAQPRKVNKKNRVVEPIRNVDVKQSQLNANSELFVLLEVILNGNGEVQMTKDEAGNEVEVPPVTAEQILARTRERKAKITLLIAIPDEHLARFHRIKDAKTLWAAIKTRFGGLDKGYDRFQRLLSLLEIHGASISTEDTNKKFLRSLPSAWSNISLIVRNKPGIDNLDIDDLYNNLKFYEADIKGSSGSSSNSQNVDFVFAERTSSTNELNVAYSVSTATGHSSQAQGIAEQPGNKGKDVGNAS